LREENDDQPIEPMPDTTGSGKRRRGRPKKAVVKEIINAMETKESGSGKKKRGRPKKAAAKEMQAMQEGGNSAAFPVSVKSELMEMTKKKGKGAVPSKEVAEQNIELTRKRGGRVSKNDMKSTMVANGQSAGAKKSTPWMDLLKKTMKDKKLKTLKETIAYVKDHGLYKK